MFLYSYKLNKTGHLGFILASPLSFFELCQYIR